jgi:hypothetical protein
MYCASNSDMMEALNSMSSIALGCLTAADSDGEQQQQQHIDKRQLLQQYVDAEAKLMMYCAGNSTALEALQSMSDIAYKALAQAI